MCFMLNAFVQRFPYSVFSVDSNMYSVLVKPYMFSAVAKSSIAYVQFLTFS